MPCRRQANHELLIGPITAQRVNLLAIIPIAQILLLLSIPPTRGTELQLI